MTYWAIGAGSGTAGFPVMSIDPISGSTTTHGYIKKLNPNTWTDPNDYYAGAGLLVNESNGDLYLRFDNFGTTETYQYDKDTNSLTEGTWWKDSYQTTVKKPTVIKGADGNVSLKFGDTLLIERKDNGELHIGENSLITIEENGVQKLYAEDANGSAIPIDITEGSKLLINGVEVTAGDSAQIETNKNNISTNADNIKTNRKNINDLGYGVAGATALTAALSSLPIAAEDAPFSCGVGTGGYSSRLAVGIGCASRLSDRLSINVGGSHVFGGSSNYGGGSLDTLAARAGMAFKLGTIHKSSNGKVEELQSQLDEVKRKSEESIVRLERENSELLARLERLEAIALGTAPASSVATR